LLDGFNKDVLSRPLSDDGLKTARAAKLGQLVVFRGHIAAYKFISGSGRPYVLMLYLRTGITEFAATALGKELPVTIISVLFMVLLCLGLAFDIASPIQQINRRPEEWRKVTSAQECRRQFRAVMMNGLSRKGFRFHGRAA